ncbi:MAG: sugar phosphate isomerase/epimerase family protein [Terriglobia bacterium]
MKKNKISIFDYNFDWALKDYNIHPRPTPGILTREEIVEFCGALGVDAIEIRHDYWHDCSPSYIRTLCSDAGLPIYSYLFDVDLAAPQSERQAALDQVYRLLDRTAELGAPNIFFIPGLLKDQWSLTLQQGWLTEGIFDCAERARSVGVRLLSENIDYPPVRPFMGRGVDCAKICAEVNSPSFRLIYDVCAPLFVEDDSLETLRAMAPYVAHVHLKNSRALLPGEKRLRQLASNSGTIYTGTLLTGGAVDLVPIMAELKRMNYDGYYLVEYQGEEDPRNAVMDNLQQLSQLFDEI